MRQNEKNETTGTTGGFVLDGGGSKQGGFLFYFGALHDLSIAEMTNEIREPETKKHKDGSRVKGPCQGSKGRNPFEVAFGKLRIILLQCDL